MYEYSVQKCMSVYSPKQELSLEEAMIPCRGLGDTIRGEKTKIWSSGENGVRGRIGLYLQHGDTYS